MPPLAWFACPGRGGCGWVTPPSEGSSLARTAVHLPSTVGLVLPGRAQLVGLRPLGDNTTTRGGLPPPGGSWEGDRDPGGHPCQEGRHHWVGALPSGRVASTTDADGNPTPLQEGRGSAGAGEKAASWGSCSLGRQTLLCPPPPEKAMAATARRVCMTAAIKEDFFVGHLLRKGPGSASSRGRQETGCLALPAGQLLAPPLPGRQWGFHSHHISGLTNLTVATPSPLSLFIPCHLPSWCRIGGGGKLSTSNQRVVQQVKKGCDVHQVQPLN